MMSEFLAESKNEVDLKTKISSGDAYTPASLEGMTRLISQGYGEWIQFQGKQLFHFHFFLSSN